MQALDLTTTRTVANDLRPVSPATGRGAGLAAAWRRLACRLTRVAPGIAIAVVVCSLFQAAGVAQLGLAALAGTASLVYLGTATLSPSPITATVDLSAAMITATLAFSASDAAMLAVVFLAHALWGILRTALDTDPPHGFTGNWSTFGTTTAILVLLGQ